MPRYIDAEDAIHELENVFLADDFNKIIRAISRTPTADVVERKKGKWEMTSEEDLYRCSACGAEWVFYEGTPFDNGAFFCPHCGAYMEKRRKLIVR